MVFRSALLKAHFDFGGGYPICGSVVRSAVRHLMESTYCFSDCPDTLSFFGKTE